MNGPAEHESDENLAQRISALEAKLASMATRADISAVAQAIRNLRPEDAHPGVSTNAQWVQRLREVNRLQPSQELSNFLRSNQLAVWLTSTVPSFPRIGDSESLHCQPFVTARLEELHQCQSSGIMFQHRSLLPGLNIITRTGRQRVSFVSRAMDTHEVVSFQNRKPDVTCFFDDEVGPSSIVFLGDVKGCSSATNGFSDWSSTRHGHRIDLQTSV